MLVQLFFAGYIWVVPNYTGKQSVNVPNFACCAGVKDFKVFFCYKFLRKRDDSNVRAT